MTQTKSSVKFPVSKSVSLVYRRFIRDFAVVITPLTNMLSRGRRFEWTDDQLKTLTAAPVLHNADFTKPFSIYCDASKVSIGAFPSN